MFQCLPDDSKSIIYRSRSGFDTEIGPVRALATTGTKVVKELRRGNEPYKMLIR